MQKNGRRAVLAMSIWLAVSNVVNSFQRPPPRLSRSVFVSPPNKLTISSRENSLSMISTDNMQSSSDVMASTTRGESERHSPSHFLVGLALAGMLSATGCPAMAYSPNDYASDVVLTAVQSLKDSSGNIDQTFKSYENIGSIITEGKGVGGIINYKGVQLDRGFIADEDTSIYNPGLTLLTESEKERLVEAVIQSRKAGVSQGQWSEQNQSAYSFLRDKLDPLRMTELRGYLAIFPFYSAIIYLAALAVQQFARNIFPAAYLVGVAAILAPIVFLVAAGP
jgi:hypothetical protein